MFRDELSKCEQEMKQKYDSILKKHEKDKEELRHRLDEIKANDLKTKDQLKEAGLVCKHFSLFDQSVKIIVFVFCRKLFCVLLHLLKILIILQVP